jgi:WD40 repeat protein
VRVIPEEHRLHEPYKEPLPAGAIARLGTTQLHSGFNVVTAGPDDTFVSAGGYGGLQKWGAKTGALLATEGLPKDAYVNVVAATKDKKLAAFASHTDVFWVDLATLKILRVLELFGGGGGDRIEDVAFLDDGNLVVGACSKDPSVALRVFDPQGRQRRTFTVPPPKESYLDTCAGPIAISNGRMAVGLRDKGKLISLKDEEVLGTFESGVAVEAVAFSPDGAQVLFGGYGDAVNAFDVKTQRAVRSYGFFSYDEDRHVEGITFSPDGRSVAVSASASVRIYDAASGLERLRIGGGVDGAVNTRDSLASLGGVLAFPMSAPDLIGRFDWATGAQLGPRDLGRHDKAVRFGAFGRDGAVFTSSPDGTIRKWDAATGAPIATFGDAYFDQPIGVASDGTLLSIGAVRLDAGGYPRPSCALRLHDPGTLAVRERIDLGEPADWNECGAIDLEVSADGAIAYLLFQGRLIAFDASAKKKLAEIPLADRVDSITVSSDGTVGLREEQGWVVRDGRSLAKRRAFELGANRIAASPRELVGAAWTDSKIVFSSLSDGKELRSVEAPKDTHFWGWPTFSPDGSLLYAGFHGDGHSGVLAIAVKTGKIVGVLDRLHERRRPLTHFLATSPDGKRLLEGNDDQTALVLDATKLQGGK